ncbi:GNAT family N-acetyltransferase [Ideonella sp. A 288]|uniref:GNAT family N-acetyltransferase n=1 Tax=Ideonella sp. A 288 TaxID=1962181 RepID=UPI000B4B45F2|nr:GNAT family N-acetyltransferase [Ideonella sp. A 288]
MPAPLLIDTPRLQLLATHTGLASEVAAFYQRNLAHFAPWDPPLPADHAEVDAITVSLAEGRDAFESGRGFRWWLVRRDRAHHVIGSVHLSQVVRGAFHSCHLGYSLDARAQGHGLMHEALQAIIGVAFAPDIGLHRLQAAVRPENLRSTSVLQRLGFRQEGLARDYLYIDGAWRDHHLFALTHAGFEIPPHWPRKDTR